MAGTILDQRTGQPIASALAQIVDGPNANQAAVTDATGEFSLGNLATGEFTVRASAAGYTAVTRKVTLQANARASFALQGGIRTVSGSVTDATSRGVLPNILIAVSSGPSAGLSTRSDAAGKFTLGGVSTESTSLQASATSYLTSNWTVPTGNDVVLNVVMTRTSGSPQPAVPNPPRAPTSPAGGTLIAFDRPAGLPHSESGFTVAPTLNGSASSRSISTRARRRFRICSRA